ncbi:hypothetical protein L2E82_42351 [Cichorium intybus]|uniref:Uncharacterized protein n=1 Tax=Cichorium intybus TaxID=13427 RepID=A0ACB8ZMV6_CICIN|nr:hypothetical protein L2E82_42351 [Cichorium intybus]
MVVVHPHLPFALFNSFWEGHSDVPTNLFLILSLRSSFPFPQIQSLKAQRIKSSLINLTTYKSFRSVFVLFRLKDSTVINGVQVLSVSFDFLLYEFCVRSSSRMFKILIQMLLHFSPELKYLIIQALMESQILLLLHIATFLRRRKQKHQTEEKKVSVREGFLVFNPWRDYYMVVVSGLPLPPFCPFQLFLGGSKRCSHQSLLDFESAFFIPISTNSIPESPTNQKQFDQLNNI